MRYLAEVVAAVWRAVDGEKFWAALVKGTGSEAGAWVVLGLLALMAMSLAKAWLEERRTVRREPGRPVPGRPEADVLIEDFFVERKAEKGHAGRRPDLGELRERLGEAFPGLWEDGTEPRDLGLLLEGVTWEELEAFIRWMKAGELTFHRAYEWMARKAGVGRG